MTNRYSRLNLRFTLSFSSLFLLLSFSKSIVATDTTYTSRTAFEASSICNQLVANFDTCADGREVCSIFDGKAVFPAPYPTAFYGSWEGYKTSGVFAGSGLLPEPRFDSKPLLVNFPTPVFGFGANVFDDFDGTNFYNVITLTVTTTTGAVFSISESYSDVGDCGFLGATSTDGIVSVKVSINDTYANLEIDLMAIIEDCSCTDSDGDVICDFEDNCPDAANGSQSDTDCDNVGNSCDQCPGGDDSRDTDGDGIPDCADWQGINSIPAAWRCGNNNKVMVCHGGNQLCVSPTSVESHLSHGDYLGPCNAVTCGSALVASIENPSNTEFVNVGLQISPNPTDGDINLLFDEEIQENTVMFLSDVTGRIIAEEKLIPGQVSHLVSVTDLPKGIYLVKILENNLQIEVKQVIVN